MENNPKTTDEATPSASALDAFKRAQELSFKANDLFCMSVLVEDKLDGILCEGASAEGEGDAYTIRSRDLGVIAFGYQDIRDRAEQLDTMANDLCEVLLAAASAMQAPVESRHVVIGHANPVDDAIITWRYAYEYWRETVGDDDDKADTPEEAAEEEARKALVSVKCKTLHDVRNKVLLFVTHPYLSGMAGEHMGDLLRSFLPSH